MPDHDLSQPWTIDNLFPDWRIEGLLTEGDPVLDTGISAQQGYEGVMVKSTQMAGGLATKWDYLDTTYTTSITWGTGLDLRKESGRARARQWLEDSGVAAMPLELDGLDQELADGSSLQAAIALGAEVIRVADLVDPEWRERYTHAWWAKKRAQENG